jgi:hypothetical protein
MRPVETIPRIGRGGIKENDRGGDSTMVYFIYCKNFVNATMYSQHNNLKK